MDYEYYQRELQKVNTTGTFDPILTISNQNESDIHQPRCLSLNTDCAQALADFLKERFGVTSKKG